MEIVEINSDQYLNSFVLMVYFRFRYMLENMGVNKNGLT